MSCEMILPKLWLQRIQRIWDKTVPTDYPKSSSEFSLKFDSEIKDIIVEMENNIGSEASIITSDMIPENNILGGYLGTYDVQGVVGELTLISPEKVPTSAVGVIAMHYDKESSNWEKVEDAQVIDGYVYGTLESFSPISVFILKRDTFFTESTDFYGEGTPIFVANGVPIIVSMKDDENVLILDSNGKETIVPKTVNIIGGTIDGTDIESTSIVLRGATVNSVITGSVSTTGPVYVNKANVTAFDATVTKYIVGSGYNNRINKFKADVKNSKLYAFGSGVSSASSKGIMKGKDSNIDLELNLGANCWVKKAIVDFDSTEITYLYAGGTSGLFYANSVEINAKNGNYGDITTGGSNGHTKECLLSIENSEFNNIQSVNRGTVDYAKANIKNCTGDLYIFANPSDKTANGIIEKVKFNIDKSKLNLFCGVNGGSEVAKEYIADTVEYVKISRSSKIEYKDNSNKILENVIRIK